MTPQGGAESLGLWMSAEPAALPADVALACVRDGPVAHVVLNRPAKRNAMSLAMWAGLAPLMAELEADDSVKLVVFRGAGTQAFSAGADISEFGVVYATAESAMQGNAVIRHAQLAVEALAKPTLAVVHGVCVGGGCGLALACDMRFVAAQSRLGITPSKLGATYSIPDTRRLVALVGPSRAKDILFSGRLLDAQEALSLGLVDRVVDDAQLEQVAADYARVLLANSLQSISTAKAMINSISGVRPVPDAQLEAGFAASFASEDFREGFAAFMEKRAPRFG
ncbi:MAG: putative enoyl-CoA hydratase [Rhizobacter sp.]|nr:putative enoyl-CoA hydratase [Rhizobacter sp.]